MSGRIMHNLRSILIIEDDMDQLSRYISMARAAGLDTCGAKSLTNALEILSTRSFQIVLTDIHLSGDLSRDTFEGLTILEHIKKNMPEITAVAMTSDPKISTYERVMAQGVSYLFRKPIRTTDELMLYIEFAQRDRHKNLAMRKNGRQKSILPGKFIDQFPDGIVMSQDLRDMARLVAINGEAPLVITGETGTGKEELAKLVHNLATEIKGPIPFIAVNCANIGGDTAVSTLFGHKKGSFTGADRTVNGVIGDANGGILFLDEINTLSLECQKRLLRVLNDGSYQRLGDSQTLHSEFQVIAASNCDLYEEVDNGRFLIDLVSRLAGLSVTLRPLRERKEDLPLLVEIALARAGVQIPENQLDRLIKRCAEFYWRGNIRELFQVIRAMVILSGGDSALVNADNLPILPGMLAPGALKKAALPPTLATSLPPQIPSTLTPDALAIIDRALGHDQPLEESMDAFERMVILATIARHDSVTAAAEILGTSRSTLNAKRRRLGI